VELLPSAHVFDLVVAAVLLPLGTWLALTSPAGCHCPRRHKTAARSNAPGRGPFATA
jgi:hypothetical protein